MPFFRGWFGVAVVVGTVLVPVGAGAQQSQLGLRVEPPADGRAYSPLPTGRVRSLLRPLAVPASGLAAQRLRLDVIAQNISNAQTTRTADGGPYRRRMVELGRMGDVPSTQFGDALRGRLLSVAEDRHFPNGLDLDDLAPLPGGVQVLGIVEDAAEGPLVWDPGHPDANEDGYVRMPNVDITAEMVDLMLARRMYEANATVFEAAKSVLRTTLDAF